MPAYKQGREASRRIEHRGPDPACNPYLAFSVLLAAGLDGIEKGYEPPPAESNVCELPESERDSLGIDRLPENLWEAIKVTENSELVHRALGEKVAQSFIENKKIEWDRYHSEVSELEKDVPVL